jgi:hypothetical protein
MKYRRINGQGDGKGVRLKWAQTTVSRHLGHMYVFYIFLSFLSAANQCLTSILGLI